MGVSQGSILGALLFLVYATDVADIGPSSPIMYADDKLVLTPGGSNFEVTETAYGDLQMMSAWFCHNRLSLNPGKTSKIKLQIRQIAADSSNELNVGGDSIGRVNNKIPGYSSARDTSVGCTHCLLRH